MRRVISIVIYKLYAFTSESLDDRDDNNETSVITTNPNSCGALHKDDHDNNRCRGYTNFVFTLLRVI